MICSSSQFAAQIEEQHEDSECRRFEGNVYYGQENRFAIYDNSEAANDCRLGALPDPDECSACGEVLTQEIIKDSVKGGSCSVATHTCENHDGECVVLYDYELIPD